MTMGGTSLVQALPPPRKLWSAGGGGPFIRLRLLVLLAIMTATWEGHAQSGWTRKKDTYFLKVGYSWFNSTRYYNLDGEEMVTSEFQQRSFDLYGEYGFTDRLTLVVYFPLLKTNAFETTETVAGIGDLKMEFKYALLKKQNIPVTLSLAPEFPTGSKDNYAQSEVNDFDQINLPTGDGEFNIWSTLAASASFHPVNAYVSGHLAYNLRTKYRDYSFQDQFRFGVEAGYKVANVVWLNAMVQALQSLGDPSGTTDFVRGDGTAYTALSLGAAYEFTPHWSFSIQYWNYSDLLVSRRNIYSDPTWSVGIFYEIK